MDWLGPVISGVGSLLNSFLGTGVSNSSAKKLMKYQAELNQQGIDTANRYNLPINQLGRLREAGLNANLVYGNGTVAGLSSEGAAAVSQSSAKREFNTGLSQAVDTYYRAASIGQSIEESKAKQGLLEQQQKESAAREHYYTANAKKTDAELPFLDKYFQQRFENMQADWTYKVDAAYKARMEGDLALWKKGEVEQNIAYLAEKTNLTQEQVITEGVKRASLYSGMILNGAVIEKLAHEIAYIDAGTSLRELAYRIQDVDFQGTKMGNDWLASHPTIGVIENLIRRVLEDVGKVFGGSVSYKVN